jgi:septum formation protein
MPIWLAADPLMLASGSKVRQALLAAAGVPTEIRPADLDERATEANSAYQAPGAIAALLACKKAAAVEALSPGRLVLGADQTLALGTRRFAKPTNLAAAREQLRALAGQTHELHSAVAFFQNGAVLFQYVDTARLTMRAFSDQFLDLYLEQAGSAATESVGAYQVEGIGLQLFERIEGDYFTVLGLPLMVALDFLRRQGCLQS